MDEGVMINKLIEHTICRWFGHEIEFAWYSFDDNHIHEKCRRCGRETEQGSVEIKSPESATSYGYQAWL